MLNAWEARESSDAPMPGRRSRCSRRYTRITPAVLRKLCEEKARTGRGSHTLLKHARDIPDGLIPGVIEGWLTVGVQKACADHLAFVRKTWRELPSRL